MISSSAATSSFFRRLISTPRINRRHKPPSPPYKELVGAGFATTTSVEDNWVQVTEDSKTGFARLAMSKPPVNSLNLEFLTQLSLAVEKLENEKECKGLVLTSTVPNIFSAGLDILEMYQCSRDRAGEFWRALQDLWLKLYGSKMITLAAINGHAPAGGCLLASTCDHRAMISSQHKYTIGLNETLLGIVAPFWFKDTMLNLVGHRVTERSIQLGTLYSPTQALALGLVDELCETQWELDQHVGEEMGRWRAVPEAARILSKQMMRRETLQHMERRREEDIKFFVEFVTKDSIQEALGQYLEGLKKKKMK